MIENTVMYLLIGFLGTSTGPLNLVHGVYETEKECLLKLIKLHSDQGSGEAWQGLDFTQTQCFATMFLSEEVTDLNLTPGTPIESITEPAPESSSDAADEEISPEAIPEPNLDDHPVEEHSHGEPETTEQTKISGAAIPETEITE